MSAPTPGNFACAELQEISAAMDSIMSDDIRMSEYKADAVPAQMVLENQTARFAALEDPEKDRTMKAYWVDDCDQEDPADCSDDCIINGDEAGSSCKTFELDKCFYKELKVTDKQFRTSNLTWEQVVAVQLLKKMRIMDEYIAKLTVAEFELNLGVNAYSDGQFPVSGTVTNIPASAWNGDLFGYFDAAKQINKIGNSAMLLAGRNLQQFYWKAEKELGDAAASNRAKLSSMKTYMDLFTMQTVNPSQKAAYIINPNSIAIAHKTYYTSTPVVKQNPWRQQYKVPSYSLPGIEYDVIYTEKCNSNDTSRHWRITFTGAILTNPVGCNSTRTGFLKFLCA